MIKTHKAPHLYFLPGKGQRIGMLAADCVARAITRGVVEAAPLAGLPAWRELS